MLEFVVGILSFALAKNEENEEEEAVEAQRGEFEKLKDSIADEFAHAIGKSSCGGCKPK